MADNTGKIYITISDERKTGEGGTSSIGVSDEAKEKRAQGIREYYIKRNLTSALESQINKQVHYSIQNIGNFTGDYIAQRDVQNNLTAIGTVANILGATIGGAKLGGIGGAALFATLAVGSVVADFARSEYANNFAIKKQNRNIAMLREISGLNTLNDGSRGTEN